MHALCMYFVLYAYSYSVGVVHMRASVLFVKFWQQFSGKRRVAMSLLAVGLVMFGGTDGIISYLRARRLLARNQNRAR